MARLRYNGAVVRRKLVKITLVQIIPAFILSLLMVILFTAKPAEAGWPGTKFSLTVDVSPNGGIVRVNEMTPPSYPSSYEFSSGTVISLTAVRGFFYRFNNWDGDLSGTTNPTPMLIDCNKSITANFSLDWPLVGGIICFVLAGLLVIVMIIRRYVC